MSKAVTNLLLNFYSQNFQKAGVDLELAEELITNLNNPKKISAIFKLAKKQSVNPITEIEPFTLFDAELKKTKSFLDIGANKLTLLNQLPTFYPNVQQLIGIDIIPQAKKFAHPDISHYYQVDSEFTNFPFDRIRPNSIDLINIKFVLHHFPSQTSLNNCLKACHKVLSPTGALLFWEETFDDNYTVRNKNFCSLIQTDPLLTQQFYSLSQDEKFEFIKLNDLIVTTQSPHMPFTDQYKTWPDWLELFTCHNFQLSKHYHLGLRLNGRLKQGIHIIAKFTPHMSSRTSQQEGDNYNCRLPVGEDEGSLSRQ